MKKVSIDFLCVVSFSSYPIFLRLSDDVILPAKIHEGIQV